MSCLFERCAAAFPLEHSVKLSVAIMLGIVLLVVLILLLIGAIPAWPHSRDWGFVPSGGVGLILIVILILVLLQAI